MWVSRRVNTEEWFGDTLYKALELRTFASPLIKKNIKVFIEKKSDHVTHS